MFLRKRLARRLQVPELPRWTTRWPVRRLTTRWMRTVPRRNRPPGPRVAAELKRVNIRNGFALAIRESFDRKLGGAT